MPAVRRDPKEAGGKTAAEAVVPVWWAGKGRTSTGDVIGELVGARGDRGKLRQEAAGRRER